MIALNFHGIGTPHAGVDVQDLPYWLTREDFGALLDRIMAEHDQQDFAFTFDDGNKSDLEAAAMLAERGVQGRFFLLTSRFGQADYCSPKDARDLATMGMVVGLHGREHVDWRTLNAAELQRETHGARSDLADALGAPVTEVAIPFGAYNRRVMRTLKAQGFARIHTSDGGPCSPAARIWNRNTMHRKVSPAELEAILHNRFSRLGRLRAIGSRLVRRHLI